MISKQKMSIPSQANLLLHFSHSTSPPIIQIERTLCQLLQTVAPFSPNLAGTDMLNNCTNNKKEIYIQVLFNCHDLGTHIHKIKKLENNLECGSPSSVKAAIHAMKVKYSSQDLIFSESDCLSYIGK